MNDEVKEAIEMTTEGLVEATVDAGTALAEGVKNGLEEAKFDVSVIQPKVSGGKVLLVGGIVAGVSFGLKVLYDKIKKYRMKKAAEGDLEDVYDEDIQNEDQKTEEE